MYTPVSIRNLKQIHTASHPGAALEKKPPAHSQPTNEEAQQKADLAALEAESGDAMNNPVTRNDGIIAPWLTM